MSNPCKPASSSDPEDDLAVTAVRTRADHRRHLLGDLDALHGLLVSSLAAILSGGCLLALYFIRCWRIARSVPSALPRAPAEGATPGFRRVLVFGKHSPDGHPDADFSRRIARAAELVSVEPSLRVMLLGGGPPPTEAEIAHRALLAAGVPSDTVFEFESQSRDTLQNLRHARALLGEAGAPVILLSNRYHLPRCALFAGYLGIPFVLCAAEPQWRPTPATLAKLLLEALYCMWVDVGRRWALLIGHQRMIDKVS